MATDYGTEQEEAEAALAGAVAHMENVISYLRNVDSTEWHAARDILARMERLDLEPR